MYSRKMRMCGSPYKVGHTTVLHTVGKMNDLKIYFRRNNPLTIYPVQKACVLHSYLDVCSLHDLCPAQILKANAGNSVPFMEHRKQ